MKDEDLWKLFIPQQPEPEPVAWKDEQGNVRMTLDAGEIQSSVGYVYSVHGERIKNSCIRSDIPNGTPLYTSPPKREWQGLTDDERSYYLQTASNIGWWKASEIIEAKLKAKNGFPQTEKNT